MEIYVNENGEKERKHLLVGRTEEKKELTEFFFKQGKSCSLTGPNGIGKTYLKSRVRENIEYCLPPQVWIGEYVVTVPQGETNPEKVFWKRVVERFPDADDLEDREILLNEKDREFIDSKGKELADCDDVQSFLSELLKKYQKYGVEIRLILDEFGRLRGNADASFFETLRGIEVNAPNLAVLYISREKLCDIVSESNDEFDKNLEKVWTLGGFTRAEILKLATEAVGAETAKIVLSNPHVEECCGLHPDSWNRFYKRVVDARSITPQLVEDVLKRVDFVNDLDEIAEHMLGLMKTTCLRKSNRTYLQAFYDAFIQKSEEAETNYAELHELFEAGYIVRMPKRYLGEQELKNGIFEIGEDGEYAYLPISGYVLNYIAASDNLFLPERCEGTVVTEPAETEPVRQKKEIILTEEELAGLKEEYYKLGASHGLSEGKYSGYKEGQETGFQQANTAGLEWGRIGSELLGKFSEQMQAATRVVADSRSKYDDLAAKLEAAVEKMEQRSAGLSEEERAQLAEKIQGLKQQLQTAKEEREKAELELDKAKEETFQNVVAKKYQSIFAGELKAEKLLEIFAGTNGIRRKPQNKALLQQVIDYFSLYGFERELKLALYMQELFNDLNGIVETDYSVITMLYSKMYEGFLKKLHLPVYKKKLPAGTVSSGTLTFATAKESKITIGSFSYYFHPDSSSELQKLKDINRGGVVCPAQTWDALWRAHGKCVTWMKEIRNNVMHPQNENVNPARNMTKEQQVLAMSPEERLEKLLLLLFDTQAIHAVVKIREAFSQQEER